MKYIPDYKLIEAKKYIDELDNDLINYYIEKKDNIINQQEEELKIYSEWFEQLNRFINFNKNNIVYK